MNFELKRLSTFLGEDCSFVSSGKVLSRLSLARLGFLYQSGNVICYNCLQCFPLEGATRESVESLHRSMSPNCIVVQDIGRSDNVPLKFADEHIVQKMMPDHRVTDYGNTNAVAAYVTDGIMTCTGHSSNVVTEAKNISVSYHEALTRARRRKVFDCENGNKTSISSDGDKLKKLFSEKNRLITFRDWPASALIDPRVLAGAGFIYTGRDDRVQCVYCKGILKNFHEGEVPMDEHRKHFPRCPFVLQNSQHEMNLSEAAGDPLSRNFRQQLRQEPPQQRQEPTQLRTDMLFRDQLGTVSHQSTTETNNSSLFGTDNQQRLGQQQSHLRQLSGSPNEVKKPHFVDPARRLRSFVGHEPLFIQPIDSFVNAGFFYLGGDDRVQCYWCAGVLKNWSATDTPMGEHIRWFPDCPLVNKLNRQTSCQTVQRHGSSSLLSAPSCQTVQRHESRSPLSAPSSDLRQAAGDRPTIEPINDCMQSPQVVALIEMGFPKDLLKQVVERKVQSTGKNFESAGSLMEAVSEFQSQGVITTSASGEAGEASSASCIPVSVAAASSSELLISTPAAASVGYHPTSTGCSLENPSNEAPIQFLDPEDELAQLSDPEAEMLLEENRRLKDAKKCRVCMDKDVDTVFLPCGHLVCCQHCSPILRDCPVCRAFIKGTVRIFLSS